MSDPSGKKHHPATDIWEANRELDFDDSLKPDDPRYVDTFPGRGQFNMGELLKKLGMDPVTEEAKAPPDKATIIFCGHRGCGKSTELRCLAERIHGPDGFFTVFLDATQELDPNNLLYTDVFMALAGGLLQRLAEENVQVDDVHLTNLKNWFDERVECYAKTKELAAEIKAGAKGEVGIPFLGRLFAGITNSLKIGSTYRNEIRRVVKNSFSEFADAFNQIIAAAEERLQQDNPKRRILLLVDGTDRLSQENAQRFFLHDSFQLTSVKALVVFCAPIHMVYEGNQAHQRFDVFQLPMLKLYDRETGESLESGHGYKVMREMVRRRIDESLFDSEETLDYLIQYSGGCPRELLRLLQYTFQKTETDQFDQAAATLAVQALGTDYRRFLEEDDYKILASQDRNPAGDANDEKVRRLLYNLALLEYNRYWRRTHPAVRDLDGYQRHKKPPPGSAHAEEKNKAQP